MKKNKKIIILAVSTVFLISSLGLIFRFIIIPKEPDPQKVFEVIVLVQGLVFLNILVVNKIWTGRAWSLDLFKRFFETRK